MNRLDAEVAQLSNELTSSNKEIEKLQADLAFFEEFDKEEVLAEIQNMELRLKFQTSLAVGIVSNLNPILSIVDWFTGASGKISRQRIQDEKHIREQIKANRLLIERYDALNKYQLLAMIKMHRCKAEIAQSKIQSKLEMRTKLQKMIGPVLESAEQYRQQIVIHEKGIKGCQTFNDKLTYYANSPAERRKIHETCAEQFNGNGRPNDVARDLNRRLEADRRNLQKLEKRIDDEISKMEVVINRAFIDGNNLCFERNKDKSYFIGTKAVEAVAHALLQNGIEVTVVFDSLIGKSANRTPFDQVKQKFDPKIKVYQAPPGTTADHALMLMACNDLDCVISNDRFTDHGERPVVKNKKVFRAMVTESFVTVPMLGVEILF